MPPRRMGGRDAATVLGGGPGASEEMQEETFEESVVQSGEYGGRLFASYAAPGSRQSLLWQLAGFDASDESGATASVGGMR